jgi:dimethylargininase
VGTHYFVGLSGRTNDAGARQLIDIVERLGGSGSMVPLTTMLHLKTGVSWLEEDRILVAGELCAHEAFSRFERVMVPPAEAYAANALCINGTVLLPKGYPKTRERVSRLGYPVRTVAMSEFQKMDGGLSCLSLRYGHR